MDVDALEVGRTVLRRQHQVRDDGVDVVLDTGLGVDAVLRLLAVHRELIVPLDARVRRGPATLQIADV
ncbi:hypothetical protein ACFFX0_09120 [Citricoccus parietis]|uniref:Uncharacterized protein n=1 Tax=Citricoccus parietis TaxID=592307 RepID=A0ABV5FXE3_9MICC